MTTTVIGVGNPDRADDGAGLAVAERLRAVGPAELDVVTSSGDPIALIDAWSRASAAIVVDALVPRGEPGRIRRFDVLREPAGAGLFATSTHELGVAEAVELGRALGVLPRRLVVFGIEAAGFEPGGALSPEVARAVERATREILDEIRELSLFDDFASLRAVSPCQP